MKLEVNKVNKVTRPKFENNLKAIGGESGVKRICQAYFVELITVISILFTECQNSTWFRRYDQYNFWDLDFYIGNKGVGDFCYICL